MHLPKRTGYSECAGEYTGYSQCAGKCTGYCQCAQPFLPKRTGYSQCAQSPMQFLPILSMQETNWCKFFLNVGTGTQFDKMAYRG